MVQNHRKGAGNEIQGLKEASVRLLEDVLEFKSDKTVILESADADFHLKIVFEDILPFPHHVRSGALLIYLNPDEITTDDVIGTVKDALDALESTFPLSRDGVYTLLRDGREMDMDKTLSEMAIQNGETLTFIFKCD